MVRLQFEVLGRAVKQNGLCDFESRWPSSTEMCESSALFARNRANGHLLRGVFAIIYGGWMPSATYNDPDIENPLWEGFAQAHEATNLFLWSFFGECIHAAVIMPGSWYDSKLAAISGLYYPRKVMPSTHRDSPS